jgi:hypothetical protein
MALICLKMINNVVYTWLRNVGKSNLTDLLISIGPFICEARVEIAEIGFEPIVDILECFVCRIGGFQLLEFGHIEPMGGIFVCDSEALLKRDDLCMEVEGFLVT